MLPLSDYWIKKIIEQPESGMGYHVVTVILNNGTKYDNVVIDSGYITKIKGYSDIPFSEKDIRDIIVTHNKWDFDKTN